MTTNHGNYREEPPEQFEENSKSWSELSYSAQYYHYNKDDGKQVDYNSEIRKRNYDFIKSVKDEKSCALCEEDYNGCLVFHHIKNKEHTISQMAKEGYSLQSISDEMNKCVILCANCHRKHHDGKFGDTNFEQLFVKPP